MHATNFGPPFSTDYSLYYIRSVPEISEAFNIRKVLGRGTFGVVFLASLKNDPSKKLALKFLVITQCQRAESEVEALQLLKGHENVIELWTCVRYLDQIVLVFPAFKFNHISLLIKEMEIIDVRIYAFELLKALSFVHSRCIIHRDIKPSNFLFCMRRKRGKLIDFGLAQIRRSLSTTTSFVRKASVTRSSGNFRRTVQCQHTDQSICTTCISKPLKKTPRAGTPGYRAPEILLRYSEQTEVIDIWSAGVILLSLLSKRHPFFSPVEDLSSLCQIISIFGSSNCMKVAKDLGIILTLSQKCDPIPLDKFFHLQSQAKLLIELTQLIQKMLEVHPKHRISADEALTLPIFNA